MMEKLRLVLATSLMPSTICCSYMRTFHTTDSLLKDLSTNRKHLGLPNAKPIGGN